MAKTFRVFGYLVDVNDEYDEDYVQYVIDRFTDLIGEIKADISPEWEFDEDCIENQVDCTFEDYEKRFIGGANDAG